jgi:hypothetical protein
MNGICGVKITKDSYPPDLDRPLRNEVAPLGYIEGDPHLPTI